MTIPAFQTVRDQVAAYGVAGAPGGVSAGASPAAGAPPEVYTPRLPAVGVWDPLTARLVARYPGAGYPRKLVRLAVKCTQAVPVHVYVGAIADTARESSYGDGSLADFDPNSPPYVPENAPVYIVWETTTATETGSCTATFEQAR